MLEGHTVQGDYDHQGHRRIPNERLRRAPLLTQQQGNGQYEQPHRDDTRLAQQDQVQVVSAETPLVMSNGSVVQLSQRPRPWPSKGDCKAFSRPRLQSTALSIVRPAQMRLSPMS